MSRVCQKSCNFQTKPAANTALHPTRATRCQFWRSGVASEVFENSSSKLSILSYLLRRYGRRVE